MGIELRLISRSPSNIIGGIYESFEQSYRLKKKVHKDVHSPSFIYSIYTNSLGFRDKNIAEINNINAFEELIKLHCDKESIILINLRPLLNESFDKGDQLRFRFNGHYNELGNKIMGQHLIKQVFDKS